MRSGLQEFKGSDDEGGMNWVWDAYCDDDETVVGISWKKCLVKPETTEKVGKMAMELVKGRKF